MSGPRLCRVEWLCARPEHLEPSASTTGSDSREAAPATGGRSDRAASPDGRRTVRCATRPGIARRRWRYPHPVGCASARDLGAFTSAPPRHRRLLVPPACGPRAKGRRRTVSHDVIVLDWRGRVLARLLRGSRLQQGLQAVAHIDAAGISRTVPCRTRDHNRERLIRPRSRTVAESQPARKALLVAQLAYESEEGPELAYCFQALREVGTNAGTDRQAARSGAALRRDATYAPGRRYRWHPRN